MVFKGRRRNKRQFLKNNMGACIPEERIKTINMGSGVIEDEMFIGSVFCSDLSKSQKVLVNHQQNQNTKMHYERFGMATKPE